MPRPRGEYVPMRRFTPGHPTVATIYHAVRKDTLRTICGAITGKHGQWQAGEIGQQVTCAVCIKKLAKAIPMRTPTQRSWDRMKQRCNDPNRREYPRYGGAGITVCERWNNSFEAFLEDMGERPPGMTLDRYPDPHGNYEPGNCRWATWPQQGRNKRTTPMYTAFGKTQSLPDWCDEYGARYGLVYGRMNKYGWTLERALTEPVDVTRRARNA